MHVYAEMLCSLNIEASIVRGGSQNKFSFCFLNSKLKHRNSISSIRLKYTGDNVSTESKAICEEFSSFFRTVFSPQPGNYPEFSLDDSEYVMDEIIISREDVVSAILECPNKSSCGVDGISYMFYKRCVDYVWLPLQIIYQQSLELGVIPDEWKLSKVTPIHKKGSRLSVENYRQVSLTIVACRILERIIRKHILQFLLKKPSNSKQSAWIFSSSVYPHKYSVFFG